MNPLLGEKLEQAAAILNELDLDAWLTFVRETSESRDPALPLIFDHNLTWQSALILTRQGDRIAIVGSYDAEPLRADGTWTEIVTYVQGISRPLREVLTRLDPRSIAINTSTDDVTADGLTHGMFQLLQEYLKPTPLAGRLVSAEGVIAALRGRKSPREAAAIRHACAVTGDLFEEAAQFVRPGRSELEIADFLRSRAGQRGCGLAWDEAGCPIVNSGPNSAVGHSLPSPDIRVEPGHVVHIDFGVRIAGFCSDLQRCWYVCKPGERAAPPGVVAAFDAVRASILAAAEVLKPGVEGWQVDAAARTMITSRGYPEYQHAVGHHLGRTAHDGGGILGPRWERYGRSPYRRVEAGNVVTLELGVYENAPHGMVSLEEDLLVTPGGVEWLSAPQAEMWLVRPAG